MQVKGRTINWQANQKFADKYSPSSDTSLNGVWISDHETQNTSSFKLIGG